MLFDWLADIQALSLPPLPPDVGTLVQPDERKYKYDTSLTFMPTEN